MAKAAMARIGKMEKLQDLATLAEGGTKKRQERTTVTIAKNVWDDLPDKSKALLTNNADRPSDIEPIAAYYENRYKKTGAPLSNTRITITADMKWVRAAAPVEADLSTAEVDQGNDTLREIEEGWDDAQAANNDVADTAKGGVKSDRLDKEDYD